MTDPGAIPLSFASSLVTIFLIFSIIPRCLCNSTELYRSCSNQTSCGDVKIQYPFWGHGRVSHCGMPELEVTCDKDVAFINLNSLWYRVLEINYDDQVLRIARQDFLDGYCPPEFVNTSLDPFLFENLSGFTNITFLYACLPSAFPGPYAPFNCIVSGSSLATGYITQGAIGSGQCYRSVYFPVSVSRAVEAIGNLSAAEKILSEGFEVRWKIDNRTCSECVRSQGACGNNPETNQTICFCPNQAVGSSGPCSLSSSPEIVPINPAGPKSQQKLIIGLAIAGAGIVCIGIGCLYLCAKRLTIGRKNRNHKQIEAIIKNNGSFTPKRYSYSGIKKMTNSFKEKLGEGGFGSVYKGKVQDGDVVAVKISRESKGNGEDFINEVASFSRTSHINVIRLLGFCYEGSKRALIYEYMSNGSLDKFIYDQRSSPHKNHLKWDKLYEIAIGIARGLEYLHRGCTTRIVHFDIKPHNILLDEDFCPKISDFGLAKLSKTRESRVSMLHPRGTIGYIAPEVFSRSIGEVSYRADVHSYGMMVLEIIGARKNINVGASETYFPDWLYEHIESVGVSRLIEIVAGTNVEEEDDDDDEMISKMMIVGLWCIQINPSDRPSMTKVVEMLEGSLESLQVPPKPVSSSSVVRLSSPYSSTTTSQITATIPLQQEDTN